MSSDLLHLHRPADLDLHQAPVLDSTSFRYEPEYFETLRIDPYTPVTGGVVQGFHLRKGDTVPQATRDFLYQALLRYGFLSFAPGSVDTDSFETFSTLFGTPRFAGNPQAPRTGSGEANAIDSSRKKTRTNYIWHIDQAYRAHPQKFTALHAVKAPRFGGGTLFSDATAAYRLIDPALAAYLEQLTIINNADQMSLVSMSYGTPERLLQARQEIPPLEVPLVRLHPESGARQLFACELYTQRVLGVPRNVSDHLLQIVFEYLRSPEVTAEYGWQDGATLIWDNRIMQHRGIYNYDGQQRVLHRAVID